MLNKFYLIYKEGSLCFNIQFFVEKMKNVKKKRKMSKNLTLPSWDSNTQILEQNFPTQDLNFEGRLDQSSSRFLKNAGQFMNFLYVLVHLI